MPDILFHQKNVNMSAIHSKNTRPEIVVRKWLWHQGFRYRLNHKRLPGKPDIVLKKYRTCIFVNGCFWHGHNLDPMALNADKYEPVDISSECCRIPKSNTLFWVDKIRRNMKRDIDVQRQLAQMGWHCVTIWECQLRPMQREKTLESLSFTLNKIFLKDHSIYRYNNLEEEPSMMAAEPKP